MQKRSQDQSGFSFLEVMVSLLILSFILLGLDAMEVVANQANRNAYYLSVAVLQLDFIVARLRLNTDAEAQLLVWNQQNALLLPAGIGYISGVYPSYHISLFWGEKTQRSECNSILLGKVNCLCRDVSL